MAVQWLRLSGYALSSFYALEGKPGLRFYFLQSVGRNKPKGVSGDFKLTGVSPNWPGMATFLPFRIREGA